ncbi:PP2C family protein-serine/threonine phosphatase [Pelosinus sp. sgz500959]|uniref:PP2C family protein-serine/threonine phosphatase n=1 Tax=Pelosinus sp. sgz500959 TaxID=3242472 RepID=UPI00366E73F3
MGCKILVVDDVSVNRAVMRVALESIEDVEFVDAVNGVEALKFLDEQEFSLVILDLMMPLKDGFEVLKEMKSTPAQRDIPVIVYSANEDVESVTEALKLGAYDYFTKPLKPREMKVILPMKAKNALKSYEQQKIIQNFNLKIQVDLLMANIFQQSLLSERRKMSNAVMYGKYIPSQDIGGSFYECLQVDDTVWFIMADVSGDGVSAAMLSSMIKMEFEHCVKILHSPDKVLRVMNHTFCKITQSDYTLTAFVGMIRDNVLWYSNAGQAYPLIFNQEQQRMQVLRESSSTLGVMADENYNSHQVNVGAGDIVVTYTQGLIEDRVMIDSLGVYDDLGNCFLNQKHLIDENVTAFFTNMFRLFGNGGHQVVNSDMAMMLVCIK